MTYLILAFLFILVCVCLGYYSHLLTISGAITALFVGFFVFLGLGIKGFFILGLFFMSSSLWSKIKNRNKEKAEELLVKGSQRDWQQVIANGGLAAIASGIYYLSNDSTWLIGFCICIAAANSDTWASEIGSMSKGKPIFIRTLQRTERGTSGAVSLLGTIAAFAGSFLIAVAAFYLFQLSIKLFIIVFLLGFIGNVVDTFLGAFVQAQYECTHCEIKTEKLTHCGQKTKLVNGIPIFNNDVINFLSGFFAFILGILIIR